MIVLAGTTQATATMLSVAGPVPTSGTGAIPFTTLATTLASSGSYDGIAFAADSTLYVETSSGALYSVDPNSGAILSLGDQIGFNGEATDLASCAYNGSLTVQKDIVGRVAATDQFTMTIAGGGVSAGNTGTTTGSSTGVQTSPGSVAGPIVGIPGTSYTVTETPASGTGTSLSDYVTTWSCTNVPSPSSGAGTTFTLSFPQPIGNAGASVVCTFTNTPASIAVTKTPSPSSTNAAGQTITYSYAVTNSGPVPLTDVTVADTQTSPAGLLASGPTCVNLTNPTGTCSGSTVATLAAGQVAQFSATWSRARPIWTMVPSETWRPPSGTAPYGVSGVRHGDRIGHRHPVPPDLPDQVGQSDHLLGTGHADHLQLRGREHWQRHAEPSHGDRSDERASAIDCGSGSNVITSLVPGATVICTATYTTTQADVDAGSISNTGTVEASPPSGPNVSDSSPLTVIATQSPQISLTKSANPTTYSGPGTQITYSYAVENTGNVTLSPATVTDPMSGALPSTAAAARMSSPRWCRGPP